MVIVMAKRWYRNLYRLGKRYYLDVLEHEKKS